MPKHRVDMHFVFKIDWATATHQLDSGCDEFVWNGTVSNVYFASAKEFS